MSARRSSIRTNALSNVGSVVLFCSGHLILPSGPAAELDGTGRQHGTNLSRGHVCKEADMRVGEIHIPLQYYVGAPKGLMVGRR